MKILHKICFVLLFATFSSSYAGDCFEKPYDVADCKVKAEKGGAYAQTMLGVMYTNGQGVLQDYKQAVKWYRKAAEQNNASAQAILGIMYHYGKGVPQDYVMAHMYYNIAAVSGDKSGIKNRGLVEKDMTSSEIAEAQKLAREWMSKHQ